MKVSVLALFGEKDFQVHPEVNAAAVRKALTVAGRISDWIKARFPVSSK